MFTKLEDISCFTDIKDVLKYLKNNFELNYWEIQLILEENLPHQGVTDMIYSDYKAIIKIRKELNFKEQILTLIHELIHLIDRDCHDVVTDNLEDYPLTLYNRYHERVIEKISKILYRKVVGKKNE